MMARHIDTCDLFFVCAGWRTTFLGSSFLEVSQNGASVLLLASLYSPPNGGFPLKKDRPTFGVSRQNALSGDGARNVARRHCPLNFCRSNDRPGPRSRGPTTQPLKGSSQREMGTGFLMVVSHASPTKRTTGIGPRLKLHPPKNKNRWEGHGRFSALSRAFRRPHRLGVLVRHLLLWEMAPIFHTPTRNPQRFLRPQAFVKSFSWHLLWAFPLQAAEPPSSNIFLRSKGPLPGLGSLGTV